MNRTGFHYIIVIFIILIIVVGPVFSRDKNKKKDKEDTEETEIVEETEEETRKDRKDKEDKEEKEEVKETKQYIPVLPDKSTDLIIVEGEQAISTNFTKEPILNYGCSGYRTLQLNSTIELREEETYYADFIFYVDEPGTYELWYGGTPAGPQNELLPSYCSPFKITIDLVTKRDIYRENIVVVEKYAPAYYWNKVVDEIVFEAGTHRIRFEVNEKRRYDSRYYFYLDNFFLIKAESYDKVMEYAPDVFPEDFENRTINYPFKPIEEYEILIRDNPGELVFYIELSDIYSLIGDYLHALKYLQKASFLFPNDPQVLLLRAKNRIWKGDITEGLNIYKELLVLVPDEIDYWTEAGKVAAWTGLYTDSILFYTNGLKQFENDLSLLVNLALTYQWANKNRDYENTLEEIRNLVGNDIEQLKKLAQIFLANGYPEEAANIYKDAINMAPEHLELYLLLEEAYIENGQWDKVEEVRRRIENTFILDDNSSYYLEIAHKKQELKNEVIEEYEAMLELEPDNLDLREILARAYFWNKQVDEGINEYMNIITTNTYKHIFQLEKNSRDIMELLDRGYAYFNFLDQVNAKVDNYKKLLSEQFTKYQNSLKSKDKPEDESGTDSVSGDEKVNMEADKLASLILQSELFIEKYKELANQFESEKEFITRLIEDNKLDEENFSTVTDKIKWEWDRYAFIEELKDVESGGLTLASYILGKIDQIEGNISSSRSYFEKLALLKELNPALKGTASYSLYQSYLWQGQIDMADEVYTQNKDAMSSVIPYLDDLASFINYLYGEDEEVVAYLTREAQEEYDKITASLESVKETVNEYKESVLSNLKSLHMLFISRMRRTFFSIQEATYRLRNELGGLYVKEKRYDEAIHQFKLVLSIDPWNIDALFTMGLVYQLNGDWNIAQDYFSQVYWEDPTYNNVTSLYNQIARQHPDILGFSGVTTIDNTKIDFEGFVEYGVEINKTVGFGIAYEFLSEYLFSNTNLPFNLLQNPIIKVPVRIAKAGLTLTPAVGLYLHSALYDISASGGTITFADYFKELKAKVNGKLSALFEIKFISILASYRFDWIRDSVLKGKDPVYINGAELDFTTKFTFLKSPILRQSYIRIYGDLQIAGDSNIIYTVLGEFFLNINLKAKPGIDLNILAKVDFEDSTNVPDDGNYWSPDNDLLAGGGLGSSFWFETGEETGFGFSLSAFGGFFTTKEPTAGGNGENNFHLETEGKLELAKGFTTFFIRAANTLRLGLPVPDQNPWSYWSLTIDVGFISRIASLFTP